MTMITFQNILEYVEDVKEELFRHYIIVSLTNKSALSLLHRCVRVINRFFLRSLANLELYLKEKSTYPLYYFEADEKKWSVNFLLYCLRNHTDLFLELDHFEREDDKRN